MLMVKEWWLFIRSYLTLVIQTWSLKWNADGKRVVIIHQVLFSPGHLDEMLVVKAGLHTRSYSALVTLQKRPRRGVNNTPFWHQSHFMQTIRLYTVVGTHTKGIKYTNIVRSILFSQLKNMHTSHHQYIHSRKPSLKIRPHMLGRWANTNCILYMLGRWVNTNCILCMLGRWVNINCILCMLGR